MKQQTPRWHSAFATADRTLGVVERVWLALAALAVVIMMKFTAFDVLMRYGFNTPLNWWYDFLMNYVLPAAFFLPFSHTLAQHAHLAVEYFSRKLNPRMADVLVGIGYTASAVALTIILVSVTQEAYSSLRHEDVIAGVILWPVWPSRAIIAAAMLPLACRSLYLGVAHLTRSSTMPHSGIPGLRTHSNPHAETLA